MEKNVVLLATRRILRCQCLSKELVRHLVNCLQENMNNPTIAFDQYIQSIMSKNWHHYGVPACVIHFKSRTRIL